MGEGVGAYASAQSNLYTAPGAGPRACHSVESDPAAHAAPTAHTFCCPKRGGEFVPPHRKFTTRFRQAGANTDAYG